MKKEYKEVGDRKYEYHAKAHNCPKCGNAHHGCNYIESRKVWEYKHLRLVRGKNGKRYNEATYCEVTPLELK